ncbi:MAG: DUF3106 domain-containing protein [Elusimicrobia bacterium]|nr:DUF3106 domain-containing protein [Elusimicrobiota bacterium]
MTLRAALLFFALLGSVQAADSPESRWQALPQARREKILRNYERYQTMTPEKRRLLRERFVLYRSLPQSRRAELLKRAPNARLPRPARPEHRNARDISQRRRETGQRLDRSPRSTREDRPRHDHGPRR